MMYEPMAATEYKNGHEMKAAYSNRLHRKQLEEAAKEIAEQSERDKRTISSLCALVERQTTVMDRLVERARTNQARIADLRRELLATEEEFVAIESKKTTVETAMAIDKAAITFVKVLAAAARAYQITPALIKGRSRDKTSAAARRHIVRILTVYRPDLSLPLIGKLMNRDHSTILHARDSWKKVAHKFEKQNSIIEDLLGLGQPVDSAHKTEMIPHDTQHTDNIAACG